MPFGYGVLWENENGQELGALHEPGFDARLTWEGWHSGTRLLPFVDPYGDTVFNQLQLPVLIADLEHVERAPGLPKDLHESIGTLIAYLRSCADVHTYVKILGD